MGVSVGVYGCVWVCVCMVEGVYGCGCVWMWVCMGVGVCGCVWVYVWGVSSKLQGRDL